MKSTNQKFIIACVAAALCGTAGIRADDNRGSKGAGAEQLTGRGEAAVAADETTAADYEESAGAEKNATGEKKNSTDSRTSDERFAEAAVKSGMAEVKMGELAAQKGQSASVKQFGTRLAKDHKEANEKLKQICDQKHGSKNISEADKQAKIQEMEAEHKKMLDHLSSLSGAEFDKAFIEHAVSGHQKNIRKFEKEASEGENPAIRSFASETLPTLRDHLKMAQSLQENSNASLPELREPAGAESKSEAQDSDSQQKDQEKDQSPDQDQKQDQSSPDSTQSEPKSTS